MYFFFHLILIESSEIVVFLSFFCVLVPGAASFVLSLLEPDPDKRPSVREAIEERWINEGYAKKPLQTLTHKNR